MRYISAADREHTVLLDVNTFLDLTRWENILLKGSDVLSLLKYKVTYIPSSK